MVEKKEWQEQPGGVSYFIAMKAMNDKLFHPMYSLQ